MPYESWLPDISREESREIEAVLYETSKKGDNMSSRDFIAELEKPQRGSILDEAKRIINGERQDRYGDPDDCFTKIALFWGAYLENTFSPHDVAILMALLKIARAGNGIFHRDNYVDAAAYIALACELHKGRDK